MVTYIICFLMFGVLIIACLPDDKILEDHEQNTNNDGNIEFTGKLKSRFTYFFVTIFILLWVFGIIGNLLNLQCLRMSLDSSGKHSICSLALEVDKIFSTSASEFKFSKTYFEYGVMKVMRGDKEGARKSFHTAVTKLGIVPEDDLSNLRDDIKSRLNDMIIKAKGLQNSHPEVFNIWTDVLSNYRIDTVKWSQKNDRP